MDKSPTFTRTLSSEDPSTLKPELTTLKNPRSMELPIVGTSQPPEMSAGNLYSRIIEEAMAKFNRDEIKEEETDSLSIESLSEAVTLSDTQATYPTSSSSLGLSTENESETKGNKGVMNSSSGLSNRQRKGGVSHIFWEVASEVIQEVH